MAIAFDAATDGGVVFSNTLIFAHTCSGSNRILFVSCFGTVTDTITGVTYNGVAMTLTGKDVTAGDRYTYQFMLVAPTTGSNNVVVTASASDALDAHAASYTGASQSGQPDATTHGNGNTGGADITVTVVADQSWIIGTFRGAGGATPNSGTTGRVASGDLYTGDSNGPKSPGTAGVGYNSPTNVFAYIVTSFAPAGGGATGFTPLLSDLWARMVQGN